MEELFILAAVMLVLGTFFSWTLPKVQPPLEEMDETGRAYNGAALTSSRVSQILGAILLLIWLVALTIRAVT